MSRRLITLSLIALLTSALLSPQLPPAQKLSPEDDREFNKELERLRSLLSTANDRAAVELQIANTYAAGGQYVEAIQRLRELVDANLGIDPSGDPDFASVRNTVEFQAIMEQVRRQTPRVSNSHRIATIDKRDIFPENLAFDPKRRAFYLGSTARNAIVKCSVRGVCRPFVGQSGETKAYILGLKIDQPSNAIWATTNTSNGASLCRYNLETGNLEQSARLEGKHLFNDLAISRKGVVYVSDTSEGAVYQLNIHNNTLRKVASEHTFAAANGIAISPDQTLLYVSVWGDGIDVIDISSGSVRPVPHPDNICLSFIDGLYATKGSLVAIQNGPMVPRIVQFGLSKSGKEIVDMKVVERRNPLFDGLTTGALVGNDLYYVANPQIDKKNGGRLDPLQILAIRVKR